ncbi:MAG: hypothetical protein EA376_03640 [Phycisphaeraceae bacterium]|nr:MAG: hypothetical protein EA376_03640 [Phycisphaeraceae bacterium]
MRIWLDRKYTKRDLAQCEYLSFNGRKYHDDLGWRTEPDGLPILSARLLRKLQGHDTVSGPRPGWNIVSDRVKRAVESADLRHIAIHPVALVRGRGRPDDPRLSWEDHGDPWWELTSDLALPPLSPSVQVVAQDNSPFVSYETQNLEIREGHYQIPELHYVRSEIEEREPFDLALTHEHFGKPPFQQRKIASQRLYQLFQEHGFKASWIPVRLDD